MTLGLLLAGTLGCAAADESVLTPMSKEAGIDAKPSADPDADRDTGNASVDPTGDSATTAVDSEGKATDTGEAETASSGGDAPGPDCPTCITSNCAAEQAACSSDTNCVDRASCYTGCSKATDPPGCRSSCDSAHPSGAADAYLGCVSVRCKMCKL